MSDIVVSVESVSKKFTRHLGRSLRYAVRDMLTELTGRSRRSDRLRTGEFWALKDVGFELRRASGVGLIGANGSGKTTLLRLLSGLIKPDEGRITIRGSVAPLIALGAGFNPVLTGRENIYTNMAMIGLSHSAIKSRIDEVLAFAEIGDAIDAPLQTYSSGMAARLGFACAIHTTPDIVLVDEVLSVGDMRFRAKCYRKLAELRESGASFVLVSHSLNSILSMCDHVIYLKKGRTVAAGDPADVVTLYENDMSESDALSSSVASTASASTGVTTGVKLLGVELTDAQGLPVPHLSSGVPARLVIRYRSDVHVTDFMVQVLIRELADDMRVVLNLNNHREGSLLSATPGDGEIEIALPYCALGPGLYTAKIVLGTPAFYVFDATESVRFLVRAERGMNQCQFYQPRSWSVRALDANRAAALGARADH